MTVTHAEARQDRQGPLVNVLTLVHETQPTLTAYGEVKSWRRLELRATQVGRLVDVADIFEMALKSEKARCCLSSIQPTTAKQEDADLTGEAEAEMAEAAGGFGRRQT